MRLGLAVYGCPAMVAWTCLAAAAQPVAKIESKRPPVAPHQGIKTPGVQIAFASLKADAEFAIAPQWLEFTAAPLLADEHGLYKTDPKKNELGSPVAPLNKPCGGAVSAFGSLWIPTCGDQALLRIDPKTWKTTATIAAGTGSAKPALAATTDSVWLLSDNRTTLSRVDPDRNLVVS